MSPKRLQDTDVVDTVELIKTSLGVGIPLILLLVLFEYLRYPSYVMWFVIPDALVTIGGVWLAWTFRAGSGRLAHAFLEPGTPPKHEYSEQEAAIVAGRYEEAATSYRAMLEDAPSNHEVRLRLAVLYSRHLDNPTDAEAQYRAVADRPATPQELWAASNGLIDLYRATNQRDLLRKELAAFVRRHRGTPHGDSAHRLLKQLAAEDSGAALSE